MARKQETLASTADAKDPVSTSDSNNGPSEAAGSPLSPDSGFAPGAGDSEDSGAPETAPSPEAGLGPVLQVGTAGPAPDSSAVGEVVATDSAATAVVTGEPSGSVHPVLAEGNAEDGVNHPAAEEQAQASPNPVTLQIYPMRSYMDEGELRRRGGPAYSVPRRHAEELVEKKLASFDPLKE
jgi:hypothetical protein